MNKVSAKTIGYMSFASEHVHVTGPHAWGGSGFGPEPTQLVPMALATCCLTMLQYWIDENEELEAGDCYDFEVLVKYEKSMAKGLYDFRITLYVDDIELLERFPEIREVFETCPVHVTLGDRVIDTTILLAGSKL